MLGFRDMDTTGDGCIARCVAASGLAWTLRGVHGLTCCLLLLVLSGLVFILSSLGLQGKKEVEVRSRNKLQCGGTKLGIGEPRLILEQ